MDGYVAAKVGAYVGAGLCIGLGAIGSAIGEGYTARMTASAIARQPKASSSLMQTMLIGQAVAETAGIFALVVGVLLVFAKPVDPSLVDGVAMAAAGLCMGAGALGAGMGSGIPGGQGCYGVARTPRATQEVTTTMLLGQAVAQTPAVFALMVSFLLIYGERVASGSGITTMAACLGAGIAMGFGAIGPGIGSGFVAGAATDGSARRPYYEQLNIKLMLTGQAVSQSTAVYSLVVALLLLYV